MPELLIVGDRVLVAPDEGEQKTDAGLILPASVAAREQIGSGRVVRVGPGYVMPNPEYSEGEPWTEPRAAVRYLPLQAHPGDVAYFLKKEALEITYQKRRYLIL
ncbi:MAG: co-chaperone GroES family protein, partial [Rhodothermales bacterium]|nr:co-chaperone GroES family protein [Rhodothermales bacterium]